MSKLHKDRHWAESRLPRAGSSGSPEPGTSQTVPALAVCLQSHTPSFILPVHTYEGKGGTLKPLRSYFRICKAAQGWRCCIFGTHLPARRICSLHRDPQYDQPCWNILADLRRQAVSRLNVTALFQSLGKASSPWPLPPLSQSLIFIVCPGITSQREELPLIDSNPLPPFFESGEDLLGLMVSDMVPTQTVTNA